MTKEAKPTMDNPLKGEVWTHGPNWAITSLGMEATNGTCQIPVEFLGPSTLTSAAAVLPKEQLREFVMMFSEALLLHGKTTVPKGIAHDFYGQHLVPGKH